MPRLTAEGVRDIVIDRMVNAIYPVGARLPTSRELAQEIGAHRNTVSKAYGLLAELGLVVSTPGRGTFAISTVDPAQQSVLRDRLHGELDNLISTSRRLGVPEEDLRKIINERIARVYQHPKWRGVFVECNQSDVDGAIAEIEASTGIRLQPLLLDQVRARATEVVAQYDIVFTNLIHLKEVSSFLDGHREEVRIVGIYTEPDEAAIVEIAGIEPGSTVGIVVDSPEGVRRFTDQVTAFTTPASVQAIMSTHDADIIQLASEVDVIVHSRSRESQLKRLDLEIKTIPLPFHVSRQSALRVIETQNAVDGSRSASAMSNATRRMVHIADS